MPPAHTPLSVALVVAGLAFAATSAAVVDVSGPRRGIAVAPFSGGAGEPPDGRPLASQLASALHARSGLRVVAPGELRRDERGGDEPQAGDIRRWADWNAVDSVVVGRRDARGVAVELRSGHSGAALAEYRLAPASHDGMPRAVSELAHLILADLGEVPAGAEDPLPPVGAAADAPDANARPAGSAAPESPERSEEASLALLPGRQRDDPISINSEELEVLPEAGGRRLVFSRNVEVLQGNVTLNADRLEAVYPQGASQPETLHATGHVRVRQHDRRARCDEATYERAADTIVCRGRAEVSQGCDRVRGQQIEFDLTQERVRVSGAASVVIQSEDEEAGACPDGSAPVTAGGLP